MPKKFNYTNPLEVKQPHLPNAALKFAFGKVKSAITAVHLQPSTDATVLKEVISLCFPSRADKRLNTHSNDVLDILRSDTVEQLEFAKEQIEALKVKFDKLCQLEEVLERVIDAKDTLKNSESVSIKHKNECPVKFEHNIVDSVGKKRICDDDDSGEITNIDYNKKVRYTKVYDSSDDDDDDNDDIDNLLVMFNQNSIID